MGDVIDFPVKADCSGTTCRDAYITAKALYLASEESSYVTGTEFLVDGGLTAAYVTPE